MREFHLPPTLKWALVAVAGVFIALLIFHAGVVFGERDILNRLHVPHGGVGFNGFGVGLPHGYMPDGHGAVGIITAVALPTITVTERDGSTESVLVTASTTVEEGSQTVASSTLTPKQQIIVVGIPGSTEGQLQAALIRIL